MSVRVYEQEIRKKVIELTTAVCRVTDTFPKDEILKTTLKEQALKILQITSHFAGMGKKSEGEKVLAEIAVIYSYLEVSKRLGLNNPLNFDVLNRGYKTLEDIITVMSLSTEFKKEFVSAIDHATTKKEARNNSRIIDSKEPLKRQETASKKTDINKRQRMILEHLKEKHRAKVSDFFTVFDGLSPKTIQRDLQNLVERHILAKDGEKRWTTYTLINVQ